MRELRDDQRFDQARQTAQPEQGAFSDSSRHKLASAIIPLIEMAEAQGRFWRAYQKQSRTLEDKTRFAVKAEPWEDRARIAREALAMASLWAR